MYAACVKLLGSMYNAQCIHNVPTDKQNISKSILYLMYKYTQQIFAELKIPVHDS